MLPIFMKKIPVESMSESELPGINPLNPKAWLIVDDA